MSGPATSSSAAASPLPSSTGQPSAPNLPDLPFPASSLPQDPFYPHSSPQGPIFLDSQACVCALRSYSDSGVAWRCLGNSTSDIYLGFSGKWFEFTNDESTITDASMNDASNPPNTDNTLIADAESESLVPLASANPNPLSVYDQACTGINETLFSTAYYNAARAIAADETPVDAAPCWRPGGIPVQIQNVSSWQTTGCYSGFFCS